MFPGQEVRCLLRSQDMSQQEVFSNKGAVEENGDIIDDGAAECRCCQADMLVALPANSRYFHSSEIAQTKKRRRNYLENAPNAPLRRPM